MSGTDHTYLSSFMEYVYTLGYCDQPDYDVLKKLLTRTLKEFGMKDNKSHLSWLESSTSPAAKILPVAGTKRKVIIVSLATPTTPSCIASPHTVTIIILTMNFPV